MPEPLVVAQAGNYYLRSESPHDTDGLLYAGCRRHGEPEAAQNGFRARRATRVVVRDEHQGRRAGLIVPAAASPRGAAAIRIVAAVVKVGGHTADATANAVPANQAGLNSLVSAFAFLVVIDRMAGPLSKIG
jgi:hypothetical protein